MRGAKGRSHFVQEFLTRVFADDLHAKRVLSLANGTLGVIPGRRSRSRWSVRRSPRRGDYVEVGNQAGRPVLSNAGVVPWDLFAPWVGEVVGVRREIVVAMDGPNSSRQSVHARPASPHASRKGDAAAVADRRQGRRNDFEDLCLSRLKALLPDGVTAAILADRGFGDVKLFEFLESLGFRYVIRFRGDIRVSAADGETRLAADWVGKGGRARKLRDADVSAARQKVGAVVCVKAKSA